MPAWLPTDVARDGYRLTLAVLEAPRPPSTWACCVLCAVVCAWLAARPPACASDPSSVLACERPLSCPPFACLPIHESTRPRTHTHSHNAPPRTPSPFCSSWPVLSVLSSLLLLSLLISPRPSPTPRHCCVSPDRPPTRVCSSGVKLKSFFCPLHLHHIHWPPHSGFRSLSAIFHPTK